MRRRSQRFPFVLPYPMAVHDGNGRYPERVKISFSDGHTRLYVEQVQQPAPVTFTEKETRRMFRQNGGYMAQKKVAEESENRKTINRLKKMVIQREQELDETKLLLRNAMTNMCGFCPQRDKKCGTCFWDMIRKKGAAR